MIKANELRIGNWLQNKNNKQYFPVTSIEFDWFYNIRFESISHTLEECEPIPLTPEILEKCGFVKSLNGDYIKGEIELWQVNNDIHYSVHDDYHIAINSVHQLQNLYFALTGEELTVTL